MTDGGVPVHERRRGVSSTSRNVDCREETYGPLVPAGLAVVRQQPVTDFDAVFINALPPNCARARPR